MNVVVTGSSGLIGSEAVAHFDQSGHTVAGVDNNMRREFFGPAGDTTWNLERLRKTTRRFTHHALDIRDRERVMAFLRDHRADLIVHCAAQPSHDKAKEIPLVDFDVNAVGTLNLLEATRLHCPEAIFILLSTNKVYGDAPNELPLVEQETRWDYARPEDHAGISESCRIDRTLHSLFGASKVAADILTQEYGRYFGLRTCVLRGGCLTGPSHSGVELHGFLSYLVNAAVTGKPYTIFGYKGKQVRDQIHSEDVILAIEAIVRNPRPGEVYNIGGGRENSASILECIELIREIGGFKLAPTYSPEARRGDHICYITDLRKLKSHYPEWSVRHTLLEIIREMIDAEKQRRRAP
jgi:CDP-paratose 2-epimerase